MMKSAPASRDTELENLRQENISLRQRLDEALSAGIAKDTFLGSMSHDIRTPMNAIVGLTALAKKHIDEKARVLDSLSKIETASAHLLSLINEVLDMSRISSGISIAADEAFFLGDLLHDSLAIIRPEIKKRGHTFRFTVTGIQYERLYGDTLRLKQIFVNIISNAVKYTPDNGSVEVSVSEHLPEDNDGTCVLDFTCTDNGIGMSEEFLSRLFTPFERENTTTVSGIEGTGLGMSIVKKLIDLMSGKILVESEPGRGTSITVSIPLKYDLLTVSSDDLKGRSILILEADPSLAAAYDSYLSGSAVEYTIVSSASEAVSALSEAEFSMKPYDAAIIGNDIGNDGSIFDIAGYFHKACPGLPIILVSELNFEEIEYRAGRSGISHFLPVPFFRKSLLNSLNNIFADGEKESGGFGSVDLSGKTILLAEDNMINMEIAKEILSSTGAATETAANGQEALDLFASSGTGHFDLILMDIQMPVMDGYEAVRAIRSLERDDAETVTILAMTANAFAEDIAKARDAGMDGHIAKPIDINKLMDTLRQFLK